MANALYDLARQGFLEGTISWNVDDIKCVLVDVADYTVNLATDEFLSDVPVAGRIATSANLTSKTTTDGTADAADAIFVAVDATNDPAEAVVIYSDSGTAATSQLIAYIDTATGLPVTPNNADINVLWDNGANKIFVL